VLRDGHAAHAKHGQHQEGGQRDIDSLAEHAAASFRS
jgi:hypothetical protein